MSPQELVQKLDEVRDQVNADFSEENLPPREKWSQYYDPEGRLHQFDSALSTARMALEHLYDEREREEATS